VGGVQEEVRDRSVALVIRVGKQGAKLSAELLKQAIRQYQKQARMPRRGRQSVKQLVRQDAGVKNIEITNRNIKSFERVARKYGIDFALKKDPAQGRYLVFFKARDTDALEAAFAEYTAKTLNRDNRKPSLTKQLNHFKQLAKDISQNKVKNRNKGGIEL